VKLHCVSLLTSFLIALVAEAASGGELMVHEAWVMLPPPNSSAAAFMNIHNHTGEEVALVGADTESASRIEIHESMISNGVAKMKEREAVSISAGETLVLAPRALHLMLLEPVDLSEGDEVQIELRFEPGQRVKVQAPVRRGPLTEESGSHHHAHP